MLIKKEVCFKTRAPKQCKQDAKVLLGYMYPNDEVEVLRLKS